MTTSRGRWLRVLVAGLLLSTCATGLAWRSSSAAAVSSCASGATMNVVAHEDDDLLFQNPTLIHEVTAGRCVRTVYFTAGDANETSTYWLGRQEGVQAAYAQMAGVADSWITSDAGITGHPITLLTLRGAPTISLAFLHLPDGNLDGSGFANDGYESLQKLYQGTIGAIHTVDGSSSYTLDALKTTLLALITSYRPDSINTLDYVGSYGDGDHSDHHTVAYLTQQAQQRYTTPHGFAGYQGYGIGEKAANVGEPDRTAKESAFLAYAADDDKECSTAAACAPRSEGLWFARQYTVGTPVPRPTGIATSTSTPTTSKPTSTSATTKPPTTKPAATSKATTSAPATSKALVNKPTTGQPTVPAPVASRNVARSATATASSQNAKDGQTAAKAIDGVVAGYPGAYTREWVTSGGKTGSWLQMTWRTPVTINRIVLFDRPNTNDQIIGGTIRFSNGTTIAVPALGNTGAARTLTFTARATTGVRLTISSVSGTTQNIGLAEIQAWTP